MRMRVKQWSIQGTQVDSKLLIHNVAADKAMCCAPTPKKLETSRNCVTLVILGISRQTDSHKVFQSVLFIGVQTIQSVSSCILLTAWRLYVRVFTCLLTLRDPGLLEVWTINIKSLSSVPEVPPPPPDIVESINLLHIEEQISEYPISDIP